MPRRLSWFYKTMFDGKAANAEKFAKVMRLPPAELQYVIYFTPRSGSSWLTDIAMRTGRLGDPGECFNPHFIPNMSKAYHVGDMDSYIKALVRRRNVGGVFGCQVTHFQITRSFGSEEKFMKYFADIPCVWLIREDIVQQAVSLAKLQSFRIGHRTMAGEEKLAEVDRKFVYDEAQIRKWVGHLRKLEIRTETMFQRRGLTPLRMSYERNVEAGAIATVNAIARHIGVEPIKATALESAHSKIGTGKNTDFSARFRRRNRWLMWKTERARRPMLRALVSG